MAAIPNAIVLLSGGLDSAVALAAMRRDGYACRTICFDYGQRHRQELAAAERIAERGGSQDHKVISIDLRAIGGSALTADIAVPKDGAPGRDAERDGVPITYVPARNLIFLSIAAGYAESVGAHHLAIGANAVDYSGYPDCRRPFIDAFEAAATLGTTSGMHGPPFRVHTPLIALSKAAIIRLGAGLGVDFALTHSCYDPSPDGRACARCDSCLIRARGFVEAGVPDPTPYAQAPQVSRR